MENELDIEDKRNKYHEYKVGKRAEVLAPVSLKLGAQVLPGF